MRVMTLIRVGLMAVLVGVTLSAQSLGVELQRVTQQATVTGDLHAAIEDYKKIVARAGADRAIAAQALVRMADCYQKLGDAEARKIYERIVREFPDRKEEVALASASLGGTAVPSAKGDRAVWTGSKVDFFGRVSPDGRFISYVDWNDGRLMLRDVVNNVDRALTPAYPNYSQQVEWSAISKDGKQIVYDWLLEGRTEVRIASIPATGFVEPRRLSTDYLTNFDWSSDGKWIAGVRPVPDDTTQIGLISVADGSFRSLKSVDRSVSATGRIRTSLRISPDGKYVAYDRPATQTSQQRDIFVLDIDSGRDIPVVVSDSNDAVMAWSPDGSWLLFSSDRTGPVGLWGLAFANGKPQGAPELLKPDIGPGFSLGLTASGALYSFKSIDTRDIAIAAIDLEAGTPLAAPVTFRQGFIDGAGNPRWSPDGQYLAYPVTCNHGCLAIRSVATGQVRRVATNLINARATYWSPDGRSLLNVGTDVSGRQGLFKVDVASGEATAVILTRGLTPFAAWSADGKKVYFNRRGVFVERDLASGAERDVFQEDGIRLGVLSPDGQYLAISRANESTRTASLVLVPVGGGQPREIFRTTPPERVFFGGAWTRDGSAFIIQKHTGSQWELWMVPVIGGGLPRRLAIDPMKWREGTGDGGALVQTGDSGFALSPDGRSIAMMVGRTGSEVWALENFLPRETAKR